MEDRLPDPSRPAHGKVGADHPDTAQDAAERRPYRIGSQKARLVNALYSAAESGLNNAEASAILGLSRNQTATRMLELREDGWAVKLTGADGAVVTRETDPGGEFTGEVHILSAEGRAECVRRIRERSA